jgi:hypothetical protein
MWIRIPYMYKSDIIRKIISEWKKKRDINDRRHENISTRSYYIYVYRLCI